MCNLHTVSTWGSCVYYGMSEPLSHYLFLTSFKLRVITNWIWRSWVNEAVTCFCGSRLIWDPRPETWTMFSVPHCSSNQRLNLGHSVMFSCVVIGRPRSFIKIRCVSLSPPLPPFSTHSHLSPFSIFLLHLLHHLLHHSSVLSPVSFPSFVSFLILSPPLSFYHTSSCLSSWFSSFSPLFSFSSFMGFSSPADTHGWMESVCVCVCH